MWLGVVWSYFTASASPHTDFVGTMDRQADVVGRLGVLEGVGVRRQLLVPRASPTPKTLGMSSLVFSSSMSTVAHRPDVATGPGERHPGCRGGRVGGRRGLGGGGRGGRVDQLGLVSWPAVAVRAVS